MDGDRDQDRYLLTRAYFYYDQLGKMVPFKFVTGDLVYAYYDQSIYDQNNALFLSLGVGSNFLKDRPCRSNSLGITVMTPTSTTICALC